MVLQYVCIAGKLINYEMEKFVVLDYDFKKNYWKFVVACDN